MDRSYLHVEQLKGATVSDLGIEVVERKGQGHPDTFIDEACESVSNALSDFYKVRLGIIHGELKNVRGITKMILSGSATLF